MSYEVLSETSWQNIFKSKYNTNGLTNEIFRRSSGVLPLSNKERFTLFNRYGLVYNNDELENLIHYVFVVRPDLNLISKTDDGVMTLGNGDSPSEANYSSNQAAISTDPTLGYIYNDNSYIIQSLSSVFSGNHDFIPFLCGRVESFQNQDYGLRIYNNSQIFTGYTQQYPGNAIESRTGISFDITFRDDKNLTITKLFHAWEYYMDGVSKGRFSPRRDYIYKKKFDYMTSIYHIVCAPDGKRIIHFTKNTGCFPTNVPHSNFSYNAGGNSDPKISISFSGFMTETLNPVILREFNYNAGFSDLNGNERLSYNSALKKAPNNYIAPMYSYSNFIGERMVGTPFITTYQRNTGNNADAQSMQTAYYLNFFNSSVLDIDAPIEPSKPVDIGVGSNQYSDDILF